MTQRIVMVICFAAVLAACGAPGAPGAPTPAPPSTTATVPPSSSAQLDGSEWVLLLLNDQPPIDGSKITLTFSDGNQFGGSGGCNSYGGQRNATKDNTLTFGTIGNNEAACGNQDGIDEDLMEQERVFLDTFRNVARYQLSQGRLELQDTAGTTTLIFTPQDATPPSTVASAAPQPTPLSGSATLDDTQWDLLLLNDQPPVAGASVLLRFMNGNELGGDDGCNYYGGTYTVSETTFALAGEIQKTTSNCDTPNLTEQEAAYYAALRNAATYRCTGDQLTFADAEGSTILVFTLRKPPIIDPALMGGWELVTLNGQPPLADTTITLNFGDNGIGGHAGCNGYGSTWLNGETLVANGGTLVLPGPAVTAMACAPGVLEQETAYVEALSDVATYAVTPEQLEIKNAAGVTTLVFRREVQLSSDPADLIGTRWHLRTVDGNPPSAPYTLIFDSATEAHGVTGCREYKATYEATSDDLYFPTIEMMSEECLRPRSDREQAHGFPESFGASARYRLSPTQLEIFPVHGGTLVFELLREDAMTPPTETVWTLQAFAEGQITTPVLPDTTITLLFDEDTLREQGTVNGSAGCNTYRGAYTYVETLVIGPLATTRVACPPAVMEQEQRFLDLLQNVRTHSLDQQLLLQTEDGRGLLFAVQ